MPLSRLTAWLRRQFFSTSPRPRRRLRLRAEELEPRTLLSVLVPGGTFAAGNNPQAVVLADVNRDGKLDLVVANTAGASVSVLLGNGDGSFQSAQNFTTGTSPWAVAVADVSGDGKPDLAVANSGAGSVSILLGNGNGTFLPAQNFAVGNPIAGSTPAFVAVADFDRDGRPDMAVANAAGNSVGILLGTGTGTFQNAQNFAVGAAPVSLAVADVNGDGKLDLAAANSRGNSVSILLGTGSGFFQAAQNVGVDLQPLSVAAADVNGDGRPDLVTANQGGGTLSLLLGNGNGTFLPAANVAGGVSPHTVAVADVNRDGRPDLVTGGGASVGLLLGNGNGTFLPAQAFTAGTNPYAVAVADVSGDGQPDVAAANFHGNNLTVLLNTGPASGTGTFQAARNTTVGVHPYGLVAADLNGDGRADLAVTNLADDTASVLLGNGDGSFQSARTFTTGAGPSGLAVADVNGDGKADLVTANALGNTVSVLLGNGNGSFQPAQNLATGADPTAVAVADVNGDGRPDLLVSDFAANAVSILLGNGDGTFRGAAFGENFDGVAPPALPGGWTSSVTGVPGDLAWQTTAPVSSSPPESVFAAEAAHVTDNVLVSPVLAIVDAPTQPLFFQQNFSTQAGFDGGVLEVAINGGAFQDLLAAGGSFLAGGYNGTISPVSQNPLAGRSAWTGDSAGFQTVTVRLPATASGQFVQLRWRFGTDEATSGGGWFVDSVSLSGFSVPVGTSPQGLAVGHFTAGGNLDVAVADSGANAVSLLLGNGNGTFAPAAVSPASVGTQPVGVAVADVNRDGRDDLVVADQASSSVSTLLGNGDGSFKPAQNFAAGVSPRSVVVADLDGDGRPDLAVASADNTGSNVFALLGNGDGSFKPAQGATAGGLPYAVVAADLTGDGQPDLAVANLQGGTVSVLAALRNAATHLQLTAPVATVFPGQPFSLTVTALTAANQVDSRFADALTFSGGGAGAVLPPDTTFTPNNDGTVTLSGVSLNTTGQQTITVTDKANNTVLGQLPLTVRQLTAQITPVTPSPRSTPVSSISIVFNLPVSSLPPGNVTLTTQGGPNQLTGAQTLTSPDGGVTWVLGNLAPLTDPTHRVFKFTLTVSLAGLTSQPGGSVSASFVVFDPALSLSGTTLSVAGTAGNDTFTFAAGPPESATLNGVTYLIDPAAASTVLLAGNGGNDQAYLFAGGTANTATLAPGAGTLQGTGYRATVSGVASVVAIGGTTDTARLSDAAGDDTFVGTPTYSYLSGSGFVSQVNGFGAVVAVSSAGGTDQALLFDTAGSSTFVGTPTYSYLQTGAGATRQVNQVNGFKSVVASAAPGTNDNAFLTDTGGSNTFVGMPTLSFLRTAAGQVNQVNAFKSVVAVAAAGTTDTALLSDAGGSNTFVGTPIYSYLTGGGAINQANGFTQVVATAASGATDTALLYDTAGSNAFVATPQFAYFGTANVINQANGFRTVAAYSAAGATDTAYLYGSAGNDTFVGTPTYSYVVTPTGLLYQATAFPTVIAPDTAGTDTALLFAGPNGGFTGQGGTAALAGATYSITVTGYDAVVAYAAATGTNHKSVNGQLAYLLTFSGNWV